MDRIFSQLTKTTFKSRVKNSFTPIYLTVIGIIQSVSLGILADKTFSNISCFNLTELVTILPYSLISLFMIIVVFYEYTWFVAVLMWRPRILDAIIPFALGFSEIAPMFYLTDPKHWYLWIGIFLIIASLAFINTLIHCYKKIIRNNKVLESTKAKLYWKIVGTLVVSCFCFFVSANPHYLSYRYCEEFFLIILFLSGIFILFISYLYWKEVHEIYELRFD